jgi:hypothetical protein
MVSTSTQTDIVVGATSGHYIILPKEWEKALPLLIDLYGRQDDGIMNASGGGGSRTIMSNNYSPFINDSSPSSSSTAMYSCEPTSPTSLESLSSPIGADELHESMTVSSATFTAPEEKIGVLSPHQLCFVSSPIKEVITAANNKKRCNQQRIPFSRSPPRSQMFSFSSPTPISPQQQQKHTAITTQLQNEALTAKRFVSFSSDAAIHHLVNDANDYMSSSTVPILSPASVLTPTAQSSHSLRMPCRSETQVEVEKVAIFSTPQRKAPRRNAIPTKEKLARTPVPPAVMTPLCPQLQKNKSAMIQSPRLTPPKKRHRR